MCSFRMRTTLKINFPLIIWKVLPILNFRGWQITKFHNYQYKTENLGISGKRVYFKNTLERSYLVVYFFYCFFSASIIHLKGPWNFYKKHVYLVTRLFLKLYKKKYIILLAPKRVKMWVFKISFVNISSRLVKM